MSSLNEIMMKRRVDEMSIEGILSKVNAAKGTQQQKAGAEQGSLFGGGADPTRPFTNLEIRSYLSELDRQQKIMVTWDTGTVYRI